MRHSGDKGRPYTIPTPQTQAIGELWDHLRGPRTPAAGVSQGGEGVVIGQIFKETVTDIFPNLMKIIHP